MVSTHSRPKAAGKSTPDIILGIRFQHTAARRRLETVAKEYLNLSPVSTHSRPKAAGALARISSSNYHVSTHSRPKAAGRLSVQPKLRTDVSTHSRPKAAGGTSPRPQYQRLGFNTQPPEGGWPCRNNPPSGNARVSTHSRPKAAG